MKKILQFLFGKGPEIFDAKNQVKHDLPKEKWDAWQKRYFSDPEKLAKSCRYAGKDRRSHR